MVRKVSGAPQGPDLRASMGAKRTSSRHGRLTHRFDLSNGGGTAHLLQLQAIYFSKLPPRGDETATAEDVAAAGTGSAAALQLGWA